MVKNKHLLPVDKNYKKFCEYMGYEFFFEKNGFYHFYIPEGHICRFKINFENWKLGKFDKNKFLENFNKK